MPLPAGWPKRAVTCTLVELNEPGSASPATARFVQTGQPWCVADGVLVAPAAIEKDFTAGALSVDLPRTDVATPAGRTWTATITVADRKLVRVFELPAGNEPLNLATTAPLAAFGELHRVVATVNGVGPDDTGNVDVAGGGSGGGGVTDHGALTGLADDDHPQYHNNTRGDTRYYPRADVDTALAGKENTGTATAAVAAHVAAPDPHTQYPLESDVTTALAGKSNTGHTHAYGTLTGLPSIPDSPDDIGAAPVAHTHPQSDITNLTTVLAGLQDQIDALAGGQIVKREAYITDGSGATLPDTGGSWQPLTGFELAIPAAVGDYVDIGAHGMRSATSTAFLDIGVAVGSTLVHYMATGTAAPAPEGDPGFYIDGGFPPQSAPRGFTVTSGHLDGGNVRFVVAVKAQGSGTLHASTNYPFHWRAMNFGVTA